MQLIKIVRFATILATIAILSISSPVMADSFFKQVAHSDAYEMMGQLQPEKNDTTVIWLSDGKACSQTENKTAVIFNAEENTIYTLNLETKEYSVMPLNPATGDAEGAKGDQEAQMRMRAQAMMGSPKVSVTATEESKKIGDWQTKLYDVDISMAMMAMKQKMWVTEDIKIDKSVFHAVCGGMMAKMPGFGEFIEQLNQIEGVPVMTSTSASVMGKNIVTTTELIEYGEKDAPDGIYEIPKDFKKVEMNTGMGGH